MRLTTLGLVVATLGLGCDGDDAMDDDGGSAAGTASSVGGTSGDDAGDATDSAADDGDSSGEPIDPGPQSHAADIQAIWDEHCVTGCHEPDGEWASNDLTDAYGAIVDMPSGQNQLMLYVSPGSPEDSYLWHKLQGTQLMVNGSGLTMPKGLGDDAPTELTPLQMAQVEHWILQGAPE